MRWVSYGKKLRDVRICEFGLIVLMSWRDTTFKLLTEEILHRLSWAFWRGASETLESSLVHLFSKPSSKERKPDCGQHGQVVPFLSSFLSALRKQNGRTLLVYLLGQTWDHNLHLTLDFAYLDGIDKWYFSVISLSDREIGCSFSTVMNDKVLF